MIGSRSLARLTGVNVIIPAIRIGADTFNLVFISKILMGYARGNNEDIPLVYSDPVTIRSAELQRGAARKESQYLMGSGMIMTIREYPAVPGIGPAVFGKLPLNIPGFEQEGNAKGILV